MKISVIDFLEHTVNTFPEQIALTDENASCTYQELRENAVSIADRLNSAGKRRPIFVISERDIRCIELFWGCLYSGNYYVPLNWKNNQGILKKLIAEIRPVALLTAADNPQIRMECEKYGLIYDSFDAMTEKSVSKKIDVDDDNEMTDNQPATIMNTGKMPVRIMDVDPAYMVFTSGSTGTPKAVVKTHRSIIEFVESFTSVMDVDCNDVFGNQVEFDYDVAAKDIYIAAAIGAKITIIPKKCFLMPARMAQFLSDQKVTTLIWSVAALRFLAAAKFMKKWNDTLYIKRVMFSGEVMAQKDLEYWIQYFSNAVFVNLYAPSEVTGNCLYYVVDNDKIPKQLPLGVPFPNIEVLVIDEQGQIVTENGIGEIYVRGAFLSSGYFHRTELTHEKFIQNPLHEDYIDTVYRTGDIAEVRNGVLYYQGRDDHQIKFMGHRIELYEIEHIFQKITGKSCACVFDSDRQIIGLFYISDKMSETAVAIEENEVHQPKNSDVDNKKYEIYKKNEEQLSRQMLTVLPKYKVPQLFVPIQRFPTNARGKKDYHKLTELLARSLWKEGR